MLLKVRAISLTQGVSLDGKDRKYKSEVEKGDEMLNFLNLFLPILSLPAVAKLDCRLHDSIACLNLRVWRKEK